MTGESLMPPIGFLVRVAIAQELRGRVDRRELRVELAAELALFLQVSSQRASIVSYSTGCCTRFQRTPCGPYENQTTLTVPTSIRLGTKPQ